jgi:ElaB/YqjD/DUF883 family membrane-anchored ribosome-binding protein
MPKVTKKSVKRAASKAVKSVESTVKDVGAKATAAAKKTDAFAKKNPWAVAGIAAGVGLAAGALLGRKGKGKKKK